MNTYRMKNHKALLFFFFSMLISAQAQQDLKVGLILSGIDYYSAGMAYGLETFAGPLELTAAYSPQFGRLLFHVNIGWQF